jgi:hypothetical protein
MIGFTGNSFTVSLNYNQCNAIIDLHNLQFTVFTCTRILRLHYSSPSNGSLWSLVFNHFLLLCPNLYSTNIQNSLKTCSILSDAPSLWIHFSFKHFAQTPRKTFCIVDHATALYSTVRYAEMCLQSRCLETDCITPFYFCVRVSRGVYQAVAWQCVDQICYSILYKPGIDYKVGFENQWYYKD